MRQAEYVRALTGLWTITPSKISRNWPVFRYIYMYSKNCLILMYCGLFYKLLKLSTPCIKSLMNLFVLPKLPRSAFLFPACFLQLDRNVSVESKLANKQQTLHLLLTLSPGICQFQVALALPSQIQIMVHLLALASDNESDSARITRYDHHLSVFQVQLFYCDLLSIMMTLMPQILVQVVPQIHCFSSQKAIPQKYPGIALLSMKMFFSPI